MIEQIKKIQDEIVDGAMQEIDNLIKIQKVVSLQRNCENLRKENKCKLCAFEKAKNLCEVANERNDLSILEIVINYVDSYLGAIKFENNRWKI